VFALEPEARVLAVSVSMAPRPVLVTSLDRPSPLTLRSLERLGGASRESAVGAAAHVARALDTEAVGRRFFATFRHSLDRMAREFPSRIPADDRHALALLQLTRVLFLYFVQAKGWLDGNPHFLRAHVDRALAERRDIHRDLLRPLFFGTLNQPAERRGRTAKRFGRVPFLNGGLFEPHALERRWRTGSESFLWRDTFDELFERFEFTLTEGDGTRVAPDMLGRVFEGLMAPAERSESGTFFTPSRLVGAVVRATLAAWLSKRLGVPEQAAVSLLDDPDLRTRDALARVTVLDPAAGSGAFLLGALEQLAAVHGGPAADARRHVLRQNLFGVDLSPAAVRLTELRLWLAVIEPDQTDGPERVRPLPNLDSVVRQGDSLLEPVIPGWNGSAPPVLAAELAQLRARLAIATGREKGAALRTLRRLESGLAATMLRRAEESTRTRVDELMAQGRATTLFGDRRGLERSERAALDMLRERRRFLWTLRRKLERDGALPWFHYQSQFGDVFTRGGFDIVVGNPPWVRAEELPVSMRRHLRARYRWWSGSRHGGGYGHQPDLSVAFLERASELVAANGTIGFVIPAKLATAAYATTARSVVAERMTVHAVADLGTDPRASFDATTYPLALVATRAAAAEGHRVRLRLEPGGQAGLPQERLREGPWLLSGERVARTLERMRTRHPLLGTRFRCHLGVKTGLNDVFLDPDSAIEPEVLAWAVRGRDVSPFTVTAEVRLLWTHSASGLPLAALPARAAAYLAPHRSRLRSRKDYDGGPEWAVFRALPAVASHRVIWADLSPRLEAAPLTGPQSDRFIALNTCYLAPAPTAAAALRLAAWLNCSWIRALAATVADPAAGGFRRFNARVVSGLPLPDRAMTDTGLLALAERARSGGLDQHALDDHCARLLGLDQEDRDALADIPSSGRHRR
jgi:methylase of polypeptide subunit release factors